MVLVKNWFCVKIPVFPSFFFLVFPALLKTLGKLKKLPPQCTNKLHFATGNHPQSLKLKHYFDTFSCTQTQKKETHNIVKSIHSSLRSESKIINVIN